jgi:hypothetical protein
LLVAGTILAAASLIACTDNPEPEYPSGAGGYGANNSYGAQYPQGGYGAQTAQGGYGAASTNPQGGAGAQTPSTSSGGTPPPTSGGTATPIAPAMAAAAQPLLTGMAQQETAGMSPVGGAMAAQFSQGQIHEQTFQLQAGKCYKVVGVGIGITELDIEIVLHQPPLPEYVAATDQGTGPQAWNGPIDLAPCAG